MIDFLGGILSFVFGMIEMMLGLAFGLIEMVFGILGGVASLVMSLGGFILVAALVILFIRRRTANKQMKDDGVLVDENGETFTSFYSQQAE